MTLNQLAAEIEAQTGAPDPKLARVIGAHKAAKDAWLLRLGDADPVIANAEQRLPGLFFRANEHIDVATGRALLDRVIE